MRILTQAGARHFCQSFSASATSSDIEVARHLKRLAPTRPLREGHQSYADLRDCLLRDAERFCFLAASNYASALRHLSAASSAWAVTGFYYSSFFSARALLAIHGGWIDGDKSWLEVTGAAPGSIELTLRRTRHPGLSGRDKSHRAFWTIFYGVAPQFQRYAPAQHAYSLSPVQNSPSWLSDNRNRLNYGSANSFELASDFLSRFNSANIASSLPGDVKVFRNVAKSMLENASAFRTASGLATDVHLAGFGNISEAVAELIRVERNPYLSRFAEEEIERFVA